MDDTDKQSQKLQSNEEVIEELTRDLENSCIEGDESLAQNITSDVETNNKNLTDDLWDIIDKEHDGNISVQNTDLLEDTDEELKDREINLTEVEKKVCILEYFCIAVVHVAILFVLYHYRH